MQISHHTGFKMEKELTTISIENNNYHIFKVESKGGILEIYFIWGKTDFRFLKQKQEEKWIRKGIQIFKNSKWYDYQKAVHHGFLFDETYWTYEQEDIFIDLPKNFTKVVDKIFDLTIPNYYLGAN